MPLPDDADLTPEALDTLRELVNEWLKKARKAVWSFQERDGFFIRDELKRQIEALARTMDGQP